MRMCPLGASGIEASVVALGTWAIGGFLWGGSEEKESIATIHAALDSGITLLDTAPVYGMGRAEEIIGKALQGGRRQQVLIASKCGLVWEGGEEGYFHFAASDLAKLTDTAPNPKYRVFRNGKAHHVRKGVEDSLRRLRTDVIDLMQVHWQDPTTPVEETMGILLQLKREGKIRSIGCSNATVEDMERYRIAGQLDVDQEKYSMLDRKPETTNLPWCLEHEVAFLAYSPLAQGLLTGAVDPQRVFKPGDMRNSSSRFSVASRLRVADFLAGIAPVAYDYGLTLGQLVTAWTLSQPGCSHVLLGARTPTQIADNAKGGTVTLAPSAVSSISAMIASKLSDM